MKVYFIGAGPGDPELLTIKAANLLRRSRFCIYAGSLVNPQILELLPTDVEKHDSAELSLPEIIKLIDRARTQGLDVMRLHTGEPSIYGAIREQMNELDKIGIDYEVVPGISAFQAAAAALKAELTAPEISQTVILSRVAGRTPVPSEQSLEKIAPLRATLCLFLSVGEMRSLVTQLTPHYGEDCPVAVVYRASWPNEKIVHGTLVNIAEKVETAKISKTALIVVGQALSRDVPASKLYDPKFSHEYRKGAGA